jgi:predicted nucleotidyltransferase
MTEERKNRTVKLIKKMAGFIKSRFKARQVILFGSYACGRPGNDSDVDLMVILNTRQKTTDKAADIKIAVDGKFGVLFPMDLIVKTPAQINKRKKYDYFLQDVLKEGVRL